MRECLEIERVLEMATTTATYGSFGELGGGASAKRRVSPERIMPKSQQVAKIRQYLSNRGAGTDVLDLVNDWVDRTVIYEVNKAEIIARVGFDKPRKLTKKDLHEMQCTHLSRDCAEDGLEICQVACGECGDPFSCKRVDVLEKEIKKHGRELTHSERMNIETAKEAKRVPKKPKYEKGQTVKCREGYSCGFTGVKKITEVKAYPDYVHYAIEGKEHGFVDEEWIERVMVKQVLKKKKVTAPEIKIEKVKKPQLPKKKVKITKPKGRQPAKIHQKVLTKEQLKQIGTFGETTISIGGTKKTITPSHFNPRSNTVYWWNQNGKVNLKIVREVGSDEGDVTPTPQPETASPSKRYLIKHPDGTHHQAKALRPVRTEELKMRYQGCTVYELRRGEWVKLFGSGAKRLKKDKILRELSAEGKAVGELAENANATRGYAYQVLKKSRKAKIAGRKNLRYKN